MKTGKNRGSITLEATMVMPEIIIIIVAFLLLAMFLHSRTCAAATVRRQVLEEYGSIMLEGKLIGEADRSSVKQARLGNYGIVSYEEEAEATFIYMPRIIRTGRIITEDNDGD